jgi:anti-sigma B factor antagonist
MSSEPGAGPCFRAGLPGRINNREGWMELNVKYEQPLARITIRGDIDDDGAAILKNKLMELQGKILKEVVIDFSGVNYIGSTGIGKMLLFYKAISQTGGSIRIVNMSEDLYKMFKIVKLDKVFELNMGE